MEYIRDFKREVNAVAMHHKDLLNIADEVWISVDLQAWSVGENYDKILVIFHLLVLS